MNKIWNHAMVGMMSKVMVVLWCVVVCRSHPHEARVLGNPHEAGLQDTDIRLMDAEEMHKEAVTQHVTAVKLRCAINQLIKTQCDEMNYVQSADPSILEDAGFLANLEIIFKPEPARNTTEQPKVYTLEDNKNINYTNENNTDIDNRLHGRSTFHRRHNNIIQNRPDRLEKNLVENEVLQHPAAAGVSPLMISLLIPPQKMSNDSHEGRKTAVYTSDDHSVLDGTTRTRKVQPIDSSTDAKEEESKSNAYKQLFNVHLIYLILFIVFI